MSYLLIYSKVSKVEKVEKLSPLSFYILILCLFTILFSNEFLRDLSRLWELRSIVPDPSNLSFD